MSEIKEALSNVQTPPFTKPEIIEKVKHLPQHIGAFSSQVAGHDLAIFYDKTKGTILKPIFDVRGVREEIFYRLLFDPKYDNDPSLVKLRSFIPTYIGSQPINGVDFVTLSDLTADFVNPSLMDVKIGIQTYDRNATKEKIAHESTKNYLNRALGFRVLAVKKWNEEESSYEEKDREFCRTCTTEEEEQILSFFLQQPSKANTLELISSVTQQLNQINDWFNKDNVDLFEFIGTSIFFIYSFRGGRLDCRLKLIDFAHIFPLQGSNVNVSDDKKDHNYLLGLNSLMKLIKNQQAIVCGGPGVSSATGTVV